MVNKAQQIIEAVGDRVLGPHNPNNPQTTPVSFNKNGYITYPFNNSTNPTTIESQTIKSLFGERAEIIENKNLEGLVLTNTTLIIEFIDILTIIKNQGWLDYSSKTKINTAYDYFMAQAKKRISDPDYAGIIINHLAHEDHYHKNAFVITEESNGNVNVEVTASTSIAAAIKGRETKLKDNKKVMSNPLLMVTLDRALQKSSSFKDFKELAEKAMMDYDINFIDYIYINYNQFAVFKTTTNNKVLLNGLICENDNRDVIVNDEYLKTLLGKRTEDGFSDDIFLKEIIVKVLHQTSTPGTFRSLATKLLNPDLTQQIINYIYDNYNSIVEFNDNGEVYKPIRKKNGKITITDSTLQEYYDKRADKLEQVADQNYVSNEILIDYLISSINSAQENASLFYSIIFTFLNAYESQRNSITTAQLYPPYINGTLPAFCKDKEIVIPFAMNPVVSYGEIKGFALKVKNIQNNEVITTLTSNGIVFAEDGIQEARFSYPEGLFVIGEFYKVQLAYISHSDIVGYYSTVGVIKHTTKPKVGIKNLHQSQVQNNQISYIGIYNQLNGDTTEKVYSYNFTIYDEDNKIFDTSGEILHNHENNGSIYESNDSFILSKTLKENKIYKICYTVTTTNGIVVSSPKYRIIQESTIPPEVDVTFNATINEENGYVDLQFINRSYQSATGKGTFVICRASSEDDYCGWVEIDRFAMFDEEFKEYNKKDFTIQHGYTYIYSLQQYNQKNQMYSNRILSNKVTASFEHIFLYDGKRQLKVKYNPKVTSFKQTLLESKTNTLGGKYPFYFRNGNVQYGEFPISGLVSYHSDEEELFLTNEDMKLEDFDYNRTRTLKSDITSNDADYFNSFDSAVQAYNIRRQYALREQLNSQENKIYNQHSRTSNLTDYNILAERIFKKAVLEFLNNGKPKLFRSPAEGNFIVRLMNSSLTPDDKLSRMLHTFSSTATEIDDYTYENLNKYGIISIIEPTFKEIREKTIDIAEFCNEYGDENGVLVSLGHENNIVSITINQANEGYEFAIVSNIGAREIIKIGPTKYYTVDFDEFPKRIEALAQTGQNFGGTITIKYTGSDSPYFGTYKSIKNADIPFIRLTKETTINKEIKTYYNLEDVKFKIVKYNYLKFSLKEGANRGIYIYNGEEKILEAHHNTDIFTDINEIPSIYLIENVQLELSAQRREIEYGIETSDETIKNAYDSYIYACDEVKNIVYNDDSSNYSNNLKNALDKKQSKYTVFINRLNEALNVNK